jgi:outer membrane translocation and assembly module TamA
MLSPVFCLALAAAGAAAAKPSPMTLRKVHFEPPAYRNRLKIETGVPIDKAGADRIAAALEKQLVEDGHADPKVEARLVPAGVRTVDLEIEVGAGERRVVREVRFTGEPGLGLEELKSELRATRVRRILPGIWKQRPPFSDAAVESDLARLRSLYISRGYYDADVQLQSVEHAGGKSVITIAVNAGPRYGIRRAELVDLDNYEQRSLAVSGGDVCGPLLRARKQAEREGRLDFDARLLVEEAPGRQVDLSARVETGPPYTVGRIEFRGHHAFRDSTIRRVFLLEEGALLDGERLRRSLARVNRLGLFETLTGEGVYVVRNPETRQAHVVVALKQRPRGRWSVSGPVGPLSFAGPLRGAIVSRLPGWGRGMLEASTYTFSFSIAGWANPLARLLPFMPQRAFLPLFALERPILPGQAWQSGFVIAPQLGAKGMAASYAMTQAHRLAKGALGVEQPRAPALVVPVDRGGALICESPQPRLLWLRMLGGFAADLMLAARPI